MKYNEEVVNYWEEHYIDKQKFGICTLCGNTGIIDTSNATSSNWIHVGRKNFCICKNGQMRRDTDIKIWEINFYRQELINKALVDIF